MKRDDLQINEDHSRPDSKAGKDLQMNAALIFAGGTGKRMNSKAVPKQFLILYGKPLIIYTLEKFENHPDIDGIDCRINYSYIYWDAEEKICKAEIRNEWYYWGQWLQ